MEGFNWITGVVFPYLNLILFLFLLVRVLKGPLISAISNRHLQYTQAMQEANQAKEEAERRSRELEAKLAGLDAEIAEIRNKSIKQAEEEAAKIVAHAEQLANHLREEARKIAASEVEQARRALREEILQQVKSNITNKVRSDLGAAQQVDLIHKNLKLIPGQLAAEGHR